MLGVYYRQDFSIKKLLFKNFVIILANHLFSCMECTFYIHVYSIVI